jgi:Clp amino terminal domain, pathogenicity island component
MGFVRSSALRRLIFSASDHAKASGWEVILPGHLVLAILRSDDDETVIARTAFERAGLSEQAIRGVLARRSRIEDQRAIGINVNPLTASIFGQADGIALASGAPETRPEHLVLSMAFTGSVSIHSFTRVARQAAVYSLASDGVSVPATSIPEDRPPGGERIFVPRARIREIVSTFPRPFPPRRTSVGTSSVTRLPGWSLEPASISSLG